jgi:hypothetical protein
MKKLVEWIEYVPHTKFNDRITQIEEDVDDAFEDIEDIEELLFTIREHHVGWEAERSTMAVCSLYNQSVDLEMPLVRKYIVNMCKAILKAHIEDRMMTYGHSGG